MPYAVTAASVFDGMAVRRHCAVVIDGPQILHVLPKRDLPATIPVRHLPEGAWLAPGFIDVQVNGGGDVLFNEDTSPGGIATIAAAHRRFGTTALMPTLLSDTREKMLAARAAAETSAKVEPSVIGIHYEGPFLSPDRAGVHDQEMLRRPEPWDLKALRPLRKGVVLLTLAPERVPRGFIAQLTAAGVRVSLGHSMATYEETRAALAEGLTGFTHLFNAMRPLASREPGPIVAALEAPQAWFGMIVDGEHVAPPMLQLALRGAAQPMLVTDAMPPVGGSRAAFTLCGQPITVRDGRCTTADGTLAGAVLDMASAVRNSVRLLDMPLAAALRLASATPAGFLGLQDRLGRLAPGYRADMVALDPEKITVLATWVAGKESAAPGSD